MSLVIPQRGCGWKFWRLLQKEKKMLEGSFKQTRVSGRWHACLAQSIGLKVKLINPNFKEHCPTTFFIIFVKNLNHFKFCLWRYNNEVVGEKFDVFYKSRKNLLEGSFKQTRVSGRWQACHAQSIGLKVKLITYSFREPFFVKFSQLFFLRKNSTSSKVDKNMLIGWSEEGA